ncbi:hypothetical protein [Bilophila wadsworthia]|uniref:hypothetical protein n=1 Tax=Bilophila wadsworthia TaxID=35833 RepID=UPI003990B00C
MTPTTKARTLPIQGHVDGLYTDRELEHIRALYAEKVTMVDKWFGHFMNNIRTLGMEDDTLVILAPTTVPRWVRASTATASCASAARGPMRNLPTSP